MSPQGRKRATAMVARDVRTVSGIGQSYHNNNQIVVKFHLKFDCCFVFCDQNFNICFFFGLLADHFITSKWCHVDESTKSFSGTKRKLSLS